MRARCIEDLLVFQKAVDAEIAVSALLKRESFQKDKRFHDDLGASSHSVTGLIAEGFPQKTDRHFAAYLYRSRGSSAETRMHLSTACTRGHISATEQTALTARYNEIEKMLTGL